MNEPVSAIWEGRPRSSHWAELRARHLANNHFCVACGQKVGLTVHHLIPVSVAPEKELEPENLRTVCNDCHFVIGHLGNWRYYNIHFDIDAANHMARVDEYRENHSARESQR